MGDSDDSSSGSCSVCNPSILNFCRDDDHHDPETSQIPDDFFDDFYDSDFVNELVSSLNDGELSLDQSPRRGQGHLKPTNVNYEDAEIKKDLFENLLKNEEGADQDFDLKYNPTYYTHLKNEVLSRCEKFIKSLPILAMDPYQTPLKESSQVRFQFTSPEPEEPYPCCPIKYLNVPEDINLNATESNSVGVQVDNNVRLYDRSVQCNITEDVSVKVRNFLPGNCFCNMRYIESRCTETEDILRTSVDELLQVIMGNEGGSESETTETIDDLSYEEESEERDGKNEVGLKEQVELMVVEMPSGNDGEEEETPAGLAQLNIVLSGIQEETSNRLKRIESLNHLQEPHGDHRDGSESREEGELRDSDDPVQEETWKQLKRKESLNHFQVPDEDRRVGSESKEEGELTDSDEETRTHTKYVGDGFESKEEGECTDSDDLAEEKESEAPAPNEDRSELVRDLSSEVRKEMHRIHFEICRSKLLNALQVTRSEEIILVSSTDTDQDSPGWEFPPIGDPVDFDCKMIHRNRRSSSPASCADASEACHPESADREGNSSSSDSDPDTPETGFYLIGDSGCNNCESHNKRRFRLVSYASSSEEEESSEKKRKLAVHGFHIHCNRTFMPGSSSSGRFGSTARMKTINWTTCRDKPKLRLNLK